MPRFNANLTMLYTDLDFMDRFAAAARDGFKAVEYLFPYAYDKDQLAEALQKNGLQQVLHNLPAGNWEGGDRGIACNPDRVGEFQDSVGRAIEYAKTLGCPQVNCLAGKAPSGADDEKLRRTMVENLKFAAPKLKET
ncbi:MAG: TIM barrel protein, partial [Acetobacteraceae bacterium]|nr:TIM barrel protein [Acetobacteraceae bacterium]